MIQQAPEKAKVYEQEERIRDLELEIKQFKKRMDELYFEIRQLTTKESELRQDRDHLLNVQADVELRYEGYRTQLAALQEQLEEARQDKTKTLLQFKGLAREHGLAISACEDMIAKLQSTTQELAFLRNENATLKREAEELRETHLVGIEELTPRPRLKERKEWEGQGWTTEKKMEWLLKRCDGTVPGSSALKPKKSQFRRETNFLGTTNDSQNSMISPLRDNKVEEEPSRGDKTQTLKSSRKPIDKKGTVYVQNGEITSGMTFGGSGPQVTSFYPKEPQETTSFVDQPSNRFHININRVNSPRGTQFASAPLNSVREYSYSPASAQLGENSGHLVQKAEDETPLSKYQSSFSKIYDRQDIQSSDRIEYTAPTPEQIMLDQLKQGQATVMQALEKVEKELPPVILRKGSQES